MKLLRQIFRALPDRLGWEKGLSPFLFKKLPSKTGWSATLGSLSVMLFGMMFVSGVFLAMHYNPSPDKAYQSIDYIMNDVPAGRLLRGIHHWGASAMVIAVFLHMATSFFAGSYKKPRELTWISGVVMLLIVLGLGFTGYLLPWDLKAYWATTVSTNIPKDIPFIGHFLSRLALGGESISGATLTRFYAVHAMLLPALLVAFIAFHIYLVRAHGLAEKTEEDNPLPAGAERSAAPGRENARVYRFYPEHLWRASIVFTIAFLALLSLSIWAHIPREQIAGTLVESYLPRPEWYYMWLFQLLTYFPGKWEAVGSLAIPFIGVTLLFLAPFIGRSRAIGVMNRPLPLALGATVIVGIVYLTAMGFAGAKPYGETIVVPDRPLSASEARGLRLYIQRECAYCHQINGQGGRRVGPDFSNTIAKHRSRDYLMRYIRDPQSVNSTSIMPKYDLPPEDLAALADFLLALDFSKYPAKTLSKAQALAQDGKSMQLAPNFYEQVELAGAQLYIKALTDIPQDVRKGLKRGHDSEVSAGNKTATKVMLTVLENIQLADDKDMMVCQDTGLPIYKLLIGNALAARGLDMVEVKKRLKLAAERATKEYPLRSNSVHPLTRKNTQTNTGQGLPIIKIDFVPDSDTLELWMSPKGSGSENMSFLRMLKPADGIKAVKRFVIECVFESGANPCPPVIVGIGIGGTSDVAAALAKEASCFRLVGSESPDPQVASLEKELLDLINQTGIGPQGLGGTTTAMACHIEWAHTHISQLPVAVNMQCWRGERACAIIDGDGNVSYPV